MNDFLELFGSYTVADCIALIVAVIFVWSCYVRGKRWLADYFARQEEQNQKIQKVLDLSDHYPEWRQQSRDMQQQFTDAINSLGNKIDQMEADIKSRKLNELREDLLRSYRYFTSDEHNPKHAWSEMECQSFWNIFNDYENLGGNGHMHNIVKPAMRDLEIIPMHEEEEVTALMRSRK